MKTRQLRVNVKAQKVGLEKIPHLITPSGRRRRRDRTYTGRIHLHRG